MRKNDAADLSGLKPLAPRSAKIWAEGASSGEPRDEWGKEEGDWNLDVVERNKEASGVQIAAKPWIVERRFGWLGTSRRLVRDDERKVQTPDQRGADRAGDDPPQTATVGEARLTVAKKSLGR